ncbi:MAG TPA: DEAD/DEAH box helicase family protein [Planctomycetota bacterium]|nr:DEAD/DEAH box helicase family protein [Planctomycetota bacterium]
MGNPGRPNADLRLAFDKGTLRLEGAGEREAAALRETGPWVWDARVSAWRCDAIHYPLVRQRLAERFGLRFVDDVAKPPRVSWRQVSLPPLRREQQEALDAWLAAGGRGQVIMPTGTGKTEIALAAMRHTSIATLVVAPVRDLMYQWHRRILRGLGYDAGILGDNRYNVQPVTVTTYDSAYAHMPDLGARFGLVVFDEEHHLPGRCRREAALFCAAPLRLGLSATPERSDGLHADLDSLIGPVIYRQEIPHAKGRTLADYDVVRIPVALADDEQARYEDCGRVVRDFLAARRQEKPDYDWQDLCAGSGKDPEARRAQKAFYARKAIEDRAREKLRVLEDLFRLHAGERTLVFAGSNAMALDVSRRFLVPTLLAHSRKRERLAVLEGFAGDRFPILVANQVLDEGVDVPEAKVAVVIGGQASTRQAKQRLGRILRRTGEARATLYEVVCQDTGEEARSRRRRDSDAYERTTRRRL